MNKPAILILMLIATSCAVAATAAETKSPEQQAVERLAALLWKDAEPTSFDVTFWLDKRGETGLSSGLEKDKSGSSRPLAGGEQEGKRPLVFKERVILAGDAMRIDQSEVKEPGDAVSAFQRTFVNVPAGQGHGAYSYNIDHAQKHASTSTSKWKPQNLAEWGRMTSSARVMLQLILGDFKKGPDGKPVTDAGGRLVILRDEAKVAKALSADSGMFRLSAKPGQQYSGHKVDVFEVRIASGAAAPEYPSMRLTLDSSDYDVCYCLETVDAKTGRTVSLRTSDDFRPAGPGKYQFPYRMTVTSYGADGAVTQDEKYAVEKASAGDKIEEGFFDFKAPAGYTVVGEVPSGGRETRDAVKPKAADER